MLCSLHRLKSSGTSEITKVTAKSKFHTDLSDQSDNEDDTGNEPPILIQNTTSKPPTPVCTLITLHGMFTDYISVFKLVSEYIYIDMQRKETFFSDY